MKADNDVLLATLKRHNPTKVRAYTSDDEYRDIAVPTRRRRWSQVIEAIEARAWSRVEMLDKSGAVLGYVENAEPARDLVDLSAGVTPAVAESHRIVELVLKAQRETMQFRDAEVTALLQAQGSVVREMVAGMQALTQMYQAQVDAAADVARLRAEAANAAAGEQSAVKELLEAAPQIVQMLPLLQRFLGAGASSTPTNGVGKSHT